MFMSAFYTESLFALLSFMGMYHITKQRYLLASILWGLASFTRSNAIIYVGFFIYELIVSRFRRHSLMVRYPRAQLLWLIRLLSL